jgi:hypothetical protein
MKAIQAVFVIMIAFGIGLLTGCSGKKAVVESSSTPPEWVIKGSTAFNDSGKKIFYGVGAVTGVHNKPVAISASESRARAEIAKIFETYTAALMKDYSASVTAGGAVTQSSSTHEEQSIEQTIKTFSSATLSGVMIIDRWIDASDGTIYSLARLDMGDFKNSVDTMKELNAEVRDYVKKNAEKSFDDLAEEEKKRGR